MPPFVPKNSVAPWIDTVLIVLLIVGVLACFVPK